MIILFCMYLFGLYFLNKSAAYLTDQPRRKFLFTHQPEKHKLGERRWDLASCQVSLNSVQRFQRRSRKCLSQSEARAAILFFRSALKHKLGRGRVDLASCQVSLNSVQRFQRKVENVSANQRPGPPSCFSKYFDFTECVQTLLIKVGK